MEVMLDKMPARDDFLDFILFANSLPGDREIVVRTPEGSLPLRGTSGLSVLNSLTVKSIFHDVQEI